MRTPTQPAASPAAAPARSRADHTRRILTLAGAVVLVSLSVYGWSLNSAARGTDLNRTPNSLVQPAVVGASGKCVVSYAVWSDDGRRFKATVTVANRDTKPVKGWQLWWIMQGDQDLSGNGKVKLDQQGTTVTVDAPKTLKPRTAVTLDVTGRYKQSNAAPMVFELDGQSCETYVSGAPGQPSRPVQKLPDGRVVLGPPVDRNNPIPGISIGPDNVVIPVPDQDPEVSAPTSPVGAPESRPIDPPTTKPTEVPPEAPPTSSTEPETETVEDPPVTTPPIQPPPENDDADKDPADQ